MEIVLRQSTFRIVALVVGLVGFTATSIIYSVFWVSVLVGVVFGTGGFLLDFYRCFRRLGGGLSNWAMVGGAAIVGINWWTGSSGFGVWPPELQYVSTVLVCWGTSMYALRRRLKGHSSIFFG